MDALRRALLPAALFMTTSLDVARAQQFRIDTEVFVDGEQEPVSTSLTIFRDEVVYDFLLGDAPETTVFDIRRGRIVLLDPQRQVRTELTTDILLEFCATMKSRAVSEGQDQLFHPAFRTEYDEARRMLTLSGELMTYVAQGVVPRETGAVRRYQQFADWHARLNAVRPGNLPPFGRIELNRQLAEHGLIPEEIRRTVVWKRLVGTTKFTARSAHEIHWLISNSDRSRIEAVGNQLTTFREVSLKEFCDTAPLGSQKADGVERSGTTPSR
jgi:hypothetical protein